MQFQHRLLIQGRNQQNNGSKNQEHSGDGSTRTFRPLADDEQYDFDYEGVTALMLSATDFDDFMTRLNRAYRIRTI